MSERKSETREVKGREEETDKLRETGRKKESERHIERERERGERERRP